MSSSSHYECSTVSFGFRIQLDKLISQINEDNFDIIKNLLSDGFIEDSNGYSNKYLKKIIESELPNKCVNFKKALKQKFNNPKDEDSESESDEESGSNKNINLNEMYLLYPVVKLIETTRWGLGRKGVNGMSCDIDNDLVDLKDRIKNEFEPVLSDYQVVLMVNQESD